MPYETHWEPTGVRWVYRGTLTEEEVLRSNQEVYEDPRFRSIRYQLVDLRGVERFTAGSAIVRGVSRKDAAYVPYNPHIRVALVANTDLTRGMATVYRLACGDDAWDVEIFDTVDDARAWLKS